MEPLELTNINLNSSTILDIISKACATFFQIEKNRSLQMIIFKIKINITIGNKYNIILNNRISDFFKTLESIIFEQYAC